MDNNLKFDKTRFYIILALILIGIVICCDLAYIFWKTNFHDIYVPSFCNRPDINAMIDCDGVSLTEYALSFGVPNALWGMLLYFVMLMLLFVDRIQAKFKNTIFDVFENPRSYIATLGIVSFILSMVLAYISIKVINKVCVLCFATYIINFLIAICARTKGFFVEDTKTTIIDFIKGAKKYLILFLVVIALFSYALYYFDSTTIFSPKIKKQKMYKEFFEAKRNKYAIKGNLLGKKNAPVIITVYSDFNCPFCRVANIVLHKAARAENIQVREVQYPLDKSCNKYMGMTLGGHENSCLMSLYALAAERQGKYWGMASLLFDYHPHNKVEFENAIKEARLDIDLEKLYQDINDPEIIKKLQDDIDSASKKGVYGTPSVEINGIMEMGISPYDELIAKIKRAQKREKNK